MRAAESRGRLTLLMGFPGYGLYGEDLGFVGDLPRARAPAFVEEVKKWLPASVMRPLIVGK